MSLQQTIEHLEAEVSSLRARVRELEEQAGSAAEQWVAALVNGQRTTGLAAFDVVAPCGTRFEVKFSRLNIPSKSSNSRRWSWGHPLGSSGAKLFHRLVLVGELDERFRHAYADPSAPYVLFDVPFSEVETIIRKDPLIQITTNPKRSMRPDSAAAFLFARYEVAPTEFARRYTRLVKRKMEQTGM